MDAIRLHAFAPPEQLVLEQVDDPVAGPGEVLVAATAHGVHLLDLSLRRGDTDGPLALPELPAIPGREVAGTVVAAGDPADAHWIGRRVAAHLGRKVEGGGYARLAAVPVDALHALPDGLDEADAIAMIGTGRMAEYTLDVAEVRADDVVVVLAAAGGLGSLFVQSALAAGARVVAFAGGPEKTRLVAGLAPEAGDRLVVLDALASDRVELARAAVAASGGASLVFDGVGGELGREAAELLRPGGRLVVHGWTSGDANPLAEPDAAGRAGIELRPALGPGAPDFGDLRGFQERALANAVAGRWRVLTHRVPLAEAARAHRELEERRTTGKVVLVSG